mmetsp:Transcript_4716/g.11094  ORF Transcript_4716/g.11094 Transcript_4716/m.11094 type:complete len:82 (+) Transcript_4716:60-305(+)
MERVPSTSSSGSSSSDSGKDWVLMWVGVPKMRIVEVYGECRWVPSEFVLVSFLFASPLRHSAKELFGAVPSVRCMGARLRV